MALTLSVNIRPAATDEELPDDLHHDYNMSFDSSEDYFALSVRDDCNKVKIIPLTATDLEKIVQAVELFKTLKEKAAL